jgi:predicted component of viral defense system (DUF524 family)
MYNQTLLVIKWNDGASFKILPYGYQDSEPTNILSSSNNVVVFGSPAEHDSELSTLSFKSDPDSIFFPIRFLENKDYQLIIKIPQEIYRCKELKQISGSEIWPFLNQNLFNCVKIVQPNLWVASKDGKSTYIPTFFNPKSHVGTVDLSIIDQNHSLFTEVLSSKINYEFDYKQLLSDIADEHLNLIFNLESASGIHLKSHSESSPDLLTSIFHLRRIFSSEELPSAVETILSSPIKSLQVYEEYCRPGQPIIMHPETINKRVQKLSFKKGGGFGRIMKGYTPTKLINKTKKESLDIKENQYIKSFLQNIENLLFQMNHAAEIEKKRLLQSEIENWIDLVADWLSAELWRNVGNLDIPPFNSQHLQRASGYRDILRYDLEIREALKLPWHQPAYSYPVNAIGDTKPIYDLYEYWCYFNIRNILIELYGQDLSLGKNFLIPSASGLSMKLGKDSDGSRAIFKTHFGKNETYIYLFYNKIFNSIYEDEWGGWSGSYTVEFEPDISIAIKTDRNVHWINFDAKYRLDNVFRNINKSEYEFELADTRNRYKDNYKKDDLNKIHCYRDALLGTRGAYILYPGKKVAKSADMPFVRTSKPAIKEKLFPNVGAFSLRPMYKREQKKVIKKFLENSIRLLANSKSYQEETGL